MYTERGVSANVIRAVITPWAESHDIDVDHLIVGELTVPELVRATQALTPEVVFK